MFQGLLGGGGEDPRVQQMAQAYQMDPAMVQALLQQHKWDTIGRVSGTLLAAGQPGPMGQRGQILSGIGKDVGGPDMMGNALNAAQMKLHAQNLQDKQSAEKRRVDLMEALASHPMLAQFPALKSLAASDPETAARAIADLETKAFTQQREQEARQAQIQSVTEMLGGGGMGGGGGGMPTAPMGPGGGMPFSPTPMAQQPPMQAPQPQQAQARPPMQSLIPPEFVTAAVQSMAAGVSPEDVMKKLMDVVISRTEPTTLAREAADAGFGNDVRGFLEFKMQTELQKNAAAMNTTPRQLFDEQQSTTGMREAAAAGQDFADVYGADQQRKREAHEFSLLTPEQQKFRAEQGDPLFAAWAEDQRQKSAADPVRERKIKDLVAQGVDPFEAVRLVDGQRKIDTNPVTGEPRVVDAVSGEIKPMTGPPGGLGIRQERVQSLMPDVDYSLGVGASAAVGQGINTVAGMVDKEAFPNVQLATQELRNLGTRVVTTLAAEVAGRPSNFLLEKYEGLVATPASLLQGGPEARTRLDATKRLLDAELQRLEALSAGFEQNPTELARMRSHAYELMQLRADIDHVLSRWGQPTPTGGTFTTESGAVIRLLGE
jgi:hypothetical protein